MRDTDRNPPAIDEDRYEGAITEVIAACDSDLHSALRALLIANEVLEAEVARLRRQQQHMPRTTERNAKAA